MATPAKKARAEKAHLVLIDESGFFLNPLVRRTWAPKGKTPVLRSWGRHRDKVSVIAALSVAPTLRRLGLYWLADPKSYVTAETVVKFLRELLKHLRGRVIVVWDGGSNHKGELIRALCARHARLHLERLPAYAPDLNPVEQVWSHLKYGRMPNFIPKAYPTSTTRCVPTCKASDKRPACSKLSGTPPNYPSHYPLLLN